MKHICPKDRKRIQNYKTKAKIRLEYRQKIEKKRAFDEEPEKSPE